MARRDWLDVLLTVLLITRAVLTAVAVVLVFGGIALLILWAFEPGF